MRLLTAAFSVAVLACSDPSVPPPPETVQRVHEPEPERVTPLPFVEQLTGGAEHSETLPLLVTLHGRGSTPESFRQFFDTLETPYRIVHLEAPIDEGNGRAWWSFRGKTRDEITAIVRELSDRTVASLRAAERRHAVRGRPLVLGFSQGAMIVYAIAIDHPQAFARGYAVSGVLFDSLLRGDLSRVTPLRVFHGEDDPIIGMDSGTQSVAPLIAAGADVRVQTFEDVPHWIMRGMRTALHESLDRYAEAGPAPNAEASESD
ncbi:MAG: dienelactone hydrolase family protein [Myxococcota bacterium]